MSERDNEEPRKHFDIGGSLAFVLVILIIVIGMVALRIAGHA